MAARDDNRRKHWKSPEWLADPYFKLKPSPPTPPDEICACEGDPPIKLMCLDLGLPNPIHCLNCNREVFPDRLPLTPEHVDAVAHWRSVHEAIGWLELDSGPYEAWARAQLLDPASPTNVEGLGVAKRLNTLRRCYLWFFQPVADDDWEPPSTCPVCAGSLVAYERGIFPQLLCEGDSLVLQGA